jgi:hypothetical protein
MTLTILVAVSALVMAALFGALLAPSDRSVEREFLRSQWPSRPAPTARSSGTKSGRSSTF